MRLDDRAVEQDRRRRATRRGDGCEDIDPHALRHPANKPIVQRLARPVAGRCIGPAGTLSTWMMPLITRRSFNRATLRGLFGSSGANRADWPSVNQNPSVMIMLPLFGILIRFAGSWESRLWGQSLKLEKRASVIGHRRHFDNFSLIIFTATIRNNCHIF